MSSTVIINDKKKPWRDKTPCASGVRSASKYYRSEETMQGITLFHISLMHGSYTFPQKETVMNIVRDKILE